MTPAHSVSRPAAVLSVLLAVASCLLVGTSARAQCRVTPGPGGTIATLLVAGPVPTPRPNANAPVIDQLHASLPSSNAPDSSQIAQAGTPLTSSSRLRWTAAAASDDTLSLSEVFPGRGPRTMFAAVTLEASEPIALHLFAGSDDGLTVKLDGRVVLERGAVREVRDDDDHALLQLTAGKHALFLRTYVNDGAMHVTLRLVDEHFAPPSPTVLRVLLDGVDDAACAALGRKALSLDAKRMVVANATAITLEAACPGGCAHPANHNALSLSLAPTMSGAAAVTDALALNGTFVEPRVIAMRVPVNESRIDVRGGFPSLEDHLRDIRIEIPAQVRAALERVPTVLAGLREDSPPAFLPRPSLTSVEGVAERLASLVADADDDSAHLIDEAVALQSMLDAIAAGRDPFAGRKGPMRRAYRSAIDGTLQVYSLYVPPSYRGDRPFPAIVTLHGLHGSAHRMLAVTLGFYSEDESRTHADRHLPALPDAQAILIAPYGFGDSGYRGPGEVDVLAVLDEVRASYAIDRDRTYMTGLSMGGIGAASVPLHNPDVFAMAAPLCGYHSYYVRSDTRGVRRPWELPLMDARSNALWAENGLHLPLYIVHGLKDQPTDNSRVLVDRYTALRYAIEVEWPDLGHNVWGQTYANGRIVPYMLRTRRDPSPRRVLFRTPSMRWNKSYWVTVDGLDRRDVWAQVDARVERDTVRVITSHTSALTLEPPASLAPAGTTQWKVLIDGDALTAPTSAPIALSRDTQNRWTVAAHTKQPTAGPIREVFDSPVLVVYGTHDPAATNMNLRVARTWAVRPGTRTRVATVADDDVTDAMLRAHNLVLVGSPASNAVLARIASQLPVRVEGDSIVAGGRTFSGTEVGATFAVASPFDPARSITVITAPTTLGVWRSRFLPDLVPDFAIYDEGLAPARGRVLIGPNAHVLAAGFFQPDGSLNASATMLDPNAPRERLNAVVRTTPSPSP